MSLYMVTITCMYMYIVQCMYMFFVLFWRGNGLFYGQDKVMYMYRHMYEYGGGGGGEHQSRILPDQPKWGCYGPGKGYRKEGKKYYSMFASILLISETRSRESPVRGGHCAALDLLQTLSRCTGAGRKAEMINTNYYYYHDTLVRIEITKQAWLVFA